MSIASPPGSGILLDDQSEMSLDGVQSAPVTLQVVTMLRGAVTECATKVVKHLLGNYIEVSPRFLGFGANLASEDFQVNLSCLVKNLQVSFSRW
jgi:hypothetical protein